MMDIDDINLVFVLEDIDIADSTTLRKFNEKKKLHHIFVDMEKAFDRVPRKL